MLGISLSFKNEFNERFLQEFLPVLTVLKNSGLQSIELRMVRPEDDPAEVFKTAEYLWGLGFKISVHGVIRSSTTALNDVFAPLELVLSELRQNSLNVNVHPLPEGNVPALLSISDYIYNNSLPLTVSVENNRKLPDKTEGDCASLVLDAVKRTDSSYVGICFDLGHYLYYLKMNHPDKTGMLPGPEFYKNVIHTHIHALNGLTTHFPLGRFEMPLKEMISPIANDYKGIYNIELTFSRFEEIISPETALLESFEYLKSCLESLKR